MKKILEEAPLGTLGRTWRSRGPDGGRHKHLHAAGQQKQTEYEHQGTCSLVFTLNHNHPPDPRKMHFLNLSMWKSPCKGISKLSFWVVLNYWSKREHRNSEIASHWGKGVSIFLWLTGGAPSWLISEAEGQQELGRILRKRQGFLRLSVELVRRLFHSSLPIITITAT